jgi:hypothetical protein
METIVDEQQEQTETTPEQTPVTLDEVIGAVQSVVVGLVQLKTHVNFLSMKAGEIVQTLNEQGVAIQKISSFLENQDARIDILRSYIKGSKK